MSCDRDCIRLNNPKASKEEETAFSHFAEQFQYITASELCQSFCWNVNNELRLQNILLAFCRRYNNGKFTKTESFAAWWDSNRGSLMSRQTNTQLCHKQRKMAAHHKYCAVKITCTVHHRINQLKRIYWKTQKTLDQLVLFFAPNNNKILCWNDLF